MRNRKEKSIVVRFYVLPVLLLLVLDPRVYAQDIQAKTTDGRTVILKSDGTWKYAEQKEPPAGDDLSSYRKPRSSTASLPLKGDKMTVWYDPAKWMQQQSDDPTKIIFAHKDGDVYALIIAERLAISEDALKAIAIKNARNVASEVNVVFEDHRIVNGVNLLCLKMLCTIQGIELIYYSYYYAGRAGTLQIITYTSPNLLGEYEQEMSDLLNGTIINE